MSLVASALSLRMGGSWTSLRLGRSMVFSLVMHLTLEHIVCSILKLTKSWRLARYPSTTHNHVVSLSLSVFQEEEHEHGDDEDGVMVPPIEHVPTTSTTVMDGPSPTPTTTNQDQGEATVEGEVASRREPPRRVQVDHLASRIISDMNERYYTVEGSEQFSFRSCCFCCHF
jgi:hypothetical protein